MGKGLEVRTTWQVEVNEPGLISKAVGTWHSLSLGQGEVKVQIPTQLALSEPRFSHL